MSTCGSNDNTQGHIEIRKRPPSRVCVKCKASESTIVVRHSAYCQPCFLLAFRTKFVKAIEKATQGQKIKGKIKDNDDNDENHEDISRNVMIAYSGGSSSSAILGFIKMFLPSKNRPRVPLKSCTVVHIDESVVLDIPSCSENIRHVIEDLHGYEFVLLRTQDVYEGSPDEKKRQLKDLFDSLTSLTAKEDLLYNLRVRLLLQAATERKCGLLLFGDTATRVAIKIISMTSRGRGYSLPIDVASERTYHNQILILRPLRDALSKEVAISNHILKIPTVFIPTLTTGKTPNSSIDRLTEDFIVSLEREFPSTASTVARTGSKLKVNSGDDSSHTCPLCLMPVGKDAAAWSPRITVSSLPSTPDVESRLGHISLDDTMENDEDNITKSLCYACIVNLRDRAIPSNLDLFPNAIRNIAQIAHAKVSQHSGNGDSN